MNSIEEKAKRYDEALKEAVIAHKDEDRHLKATLERIFPELAESEDERMRNAAIDACKYMVDNFENSTKQYEDAIVWLEKQGEKKPILDVEIPFGTDSELVEEAITIPDGCYAIIEDDKVILRKGEKKSSWSEEDENILATIIKEGELKPSERQWLRTIKYRYTWKPSDEQMKAIEHICDGNYNVDLDILDSIYKDFKKLREE